MGNTHADGGLASHTRPLSPPTPTCGLSIYSNLQPCTIGSTRHGRRWQRARRRGERSCLRADDIIVSYFSLFRINAYLGHRIVAFRNPQPFDFAGARVIQTPSTAHDDDSQDQSSQRRDRRRRRPPAEAIPAVCPRP
jgi:hypothetical protein